MRVLIVGAGPRGIEHGEAIRALEGWALAGVVDPRLDARERAAKAFHAGTFSNLTEALERISPDVVTVAVPAPKRDCVIEAIIAQPSTRAIVIEKPLALSLAAARRIAEGTEKAGILAVVCHQLRFSPEFVALKNAVDEGRLGALRLLHGECYGNLLDQGPHVIDAISWLAQPCRFTWVMSQACDDLKLLAPFAPVDPDRRTSEAHPAPLFMTHTFGMEGGLEAVVRTGIIAPPSEPDFGPWLRKRVMAVGSRAWAEARSAGSFRFAGEGGVSEQRFTLEDYKAATRSLYRALEHSLKHSEPHPTCIAEAMPSLEAIIAAARSAALGNLVALPLEANAGLLEPGARAPKRVPAHASSVISASVEGPELSILLPLLDHRGFAERCVRSWTEGQDEAPERFELIVVSDGKDAALEAQIRAALRPHDRLLILPTDDELEMYDAAARVARGELLFITEPHCIAEPEAVTETLKYMADSGEDGAVGRTVTGAINAIARGEAHMYDEGFRTWSRPGHWCKVILRAVAIKRAVYLACGGFELRYGRFAEWLLAATLHRQGYRLGYMPAAAVQHWYEPSLRKLRPFIRNFTEGECKYRLEHSSAAVVPYFGNPPEWSLMRNRAPDLAQLLPGVTVSLAKSSSQPRKARLLAALMTRLPALWLQARGNFALPKLAARVKVLSAAMRCALWRGSEDRIYRAYVDHYMRYTTLCRIEFIARQPRAAKLQHFQEQFTYRLAEISNDDLFGFYPSEHFKEISFRWASGLAAMRISVPAGEYKLIIDNGGLVDVTRIPVAFINSERVSGLTRVTGAAGKLKSLEGRVGISAVNAGQPSWLILVSPSRRRLGDPRDLGLPIASVTFERL